MSNENSNTNNAESAFALRTAMKQSQAELAQERLFHKIGKTLYNQGFSEPTLKIWLEEISLLCGAVHIMILQQHAGALKIIAQKGNTFPVGARIPMMGYLSQWLKPPVNFDTLTAQVPSLWPMLSEEDKSFLAFQYFPIAHQLQAIGLLAIASTHKVKNADISTLNAYCGFLGLALKTEKNEHSAIDDSILQKLTPREREVLALLPSGASNASLAEKLSIAPGTVKIHVERILSKLNLKDRTQAAVLAVEMGFKSDGL